MSITSDGITEVTSVGSTGGSPSGGLTDVELRATPVLVSGPLTDAQLRAADVKVSLDGEVVPVTGSFFQTTQPVSLAIAPSTPITNPNLDVALSTRTKPSDQQHVIVDTMPLSASITVADVLDADSDSNYTVGDLAKNITQTPDGRLRAVIAGLVSDVRQSFIDGETRSLSLTSDGRLRVATSESFSYLEMFEAENSFFFDIPAMSTEEAGRIDMDNNPWGI